MMRQTAFNALARVAIQTRIRSVQHRLFVHNPLSPSCTSLWHHSSSATFDNNNNKEFKNPSRCYSRNDNKNKNPPLYKEIHESIKDYKQVKGYFRDNLESGKLGASGILSNMYSWYRTKMAWKTRTFMKRVNTQINIIENNSLKIRTLFEKDLESILFNNFAAISIVLNAAEQVTNEHPFLRLPPEDRWHILASVLVAISDATGYSTGIGLFARDMNLPVKSEWYVFALTVEKDYNATRFNKIRVIMVKETMLQQILAIIQKEAENKKNGIREPEYEPEFEEEHHRVRWNTLKTMAKIYEADGGLYGCFDNLMRVEISVPLFAPQHQQQDAAADGSTASNNGLTHVLAQMKVTTPDPYAATTIGCSSTE